MSSTALRFASARTGRPNLVFGGRVTELVGEPFDDVSCSISGAWQEAAPSGDVVRDPLDSAAAAGMSSSDAWSLTDSTSRAVAALHQQGRAISGSSRPLWEATAGVAIGAAGQWQQTAPVAGVVRDGCASALPTSRSCMEKHRDAAPLGLRWNQRNVDALPAGAFRREVSTSTRPVGLLSRDVYQQAIVPPNGYWAPSPVAPPVPVPHPVNLLFRSLLSHTTHLVFGRIEDPVGPSVVIPVLRYYIVINSASLTRVSNNLPLPVTGLSLSIDADSAHWTWSATLPLRSLPDLEPDAPGELVELEAIVNGFPWRLLVERKGEKERFDSASLSIGGRGIAAELSDPTYPVVSHDNVAGAAMAQQLAAGALSINGVPLGWSLDWQAADWLVPAGAWVYSGTPLDAVVRIAAAAGAYVQADPESRALRVVPRYPVAPWEWSGATPALVLPASAVIERGTDHVNRAAYNVVYVSGQAGGVLARVKRAGSAGDRAAQMIVDGLITHADAARGRGLEVLGNTGAQQIVSLETGILPASGVIHVGTLMDWTRGADARRGIVRSLSVTASVPTGASKDPVKVRQTIGVEIHG